MINFCEEREKADAIMRISSLLGSCSCEQVLRLLDVVEEHATVDREEGGAS